MAQYNIDPFGKMAAAERWISKDKLQRQQMQRQNALQDIQGERAKIQFDQGQQSYGDKQNFMRSARENGIEAAIKQFPVIGGEMVRQQQGASQRGFAPVTLYNDATNEYKMVMPSFNPSDGSASLSNLDIPEGFSVIKETPESKRAGAVTQKKQILAVEAAGERLKQQESIVGKKTAERWAGDIDTAYEAIDALPLIKRNIELMKLVQTGGIDKALISAKQFLGVESANEAELAQNIGKAVLKQLKPTFGAQFTVQEGRELKTIEAGLGKSTKGNQRLLNQALQIYERAANRGLKAAKRTKDTDAYNAITEGMNYTFKNPPETNTQQQNTGLPQGVSEDDIAETMRANSMTREQVLSKLRGQ